MDVGRILRKGGQVIWHAKHAAKFFGPCPFWEWPHLSPRYNSGINHKSIIKIIILLVSTVLIVCNMQAQPQTHNKLVYKQWHACACHESF